MAKTGNLTPKQKSAIAALMTSRDVKAAAQACGVGYRSLCRWLDNPLFRAELAAAEGGVIDQMTRRLLAMGDQAVDTLRNLQTSQNTSDGVKLRAAQVVLDSLLKMRELNDLERRIAEIEQTVLSKVR